MLDAFACLNSSSSFYSALLSIMISRAQWNVLLIFHKSLFLVLPDRKTSASQNQSCTFDYQSSTEDLNCENLRMSPSRSLTWLPMNHVRQLWYENSEGNAQNKVQIHQALKHRQSRGKLGCQADILPCQSSLTDLDLYRVSWLWAARSIFLSVAQTRMALDIESGRICVIRGSLPFNCELRSTGYDDDDVDDDDNWSLFN